MYKHWFVSRQKRRLTQILPALIAFSDVCLGQKWAGNVELQLKFEDELQNRSITEHGNLRARRAGNGGGGTRTLFKQMKDLGLVFLEEENGHCQLTLVGEELVKGNITFVDAIRMQLKRYQYPSAACWSGSGSVSHDIKVHPFQFMFRLLREPRLEGKLHVNELRYIVIHQAISDSKHCFEKVVTEILNYRNDADCICEIDDEKKTYWNIANTFFNYISLTQYVDRGQQIIFVRQGKENEIDEFIEESPKFIPNPELAENYLRAFGKGLSAKDMRDFKKAQSWSQKEINEARIRKEYVLLALKTPILGITSDIINVISLNTGIDEREVEKFLIKNYPHKNIDDFFVNYKELAHLGTDGAKEFEMATCEMFKKIFKMRAKHVGSIGNTPDVFIESDDEKYCAIIDNKAYKNGYSITGNHKRVMEDVYIPNVKAYGGSEYPLVFFAYIAGSFGGNINAQLNEIYNNTGVKGSAMPVDILIDFAQDYAKLDYDHSTIKKVFSVNREVRVSDIEEIVSYSDKIREYESDLPIAADIVPYNV